MKQLELSGAADADLFDILAYGTAVHGTTASDAYYDGLMQAFDFLCATPGAGSPVELPGSDLRRWRHRQHHIFYRPDEQSIFVVRVLHVAADSVRWLPN